MKFDWQNIGIKELSAIVSSHLQKNGIEVVLVGGGCVSIYSDNQYMSNDIGTDWQPSFSGTISNL